VRGRFRRELEFPTHVLPGFFLACSSSVIFTCVLVFLSCSPYFLLVKSTPSHEQALTKVHVLPPPEFAPGHTNFASCPFIVVLFEFRLRLFRIWSQRRFFDQLAADALSTSIFLIPFFSYQPQERVFACIVHVFFLFLPSLPPEVVCPSIVSVFPLVLPSIIPNTSEHSLQVLRRFYLPPPLRLFSFAPAHLPRTE